MQINTERIHPEWKASQIVTATIFVVLVGLAFLLLYRLRMVIFILFIAIVLGTAIRPAVDWLNRRGMSRSSGLILIFLLLLLIMTSIIAMVIPLLAEQVTQILIDVPAYYERFRGTLLTSPSALVQRLGLQIPPRLFLVTTELPSDGEPLGRVAQFFIYAGLLTRGALATLAVILLSFYWTLESERAIRGILLFLPSSRRDEIREFITGMETKLGGFIRGELLLMLSVGLLSFVAYLLIGLPYPLVLALIAGIMEAIPIFGPALGAIPAIITALSVDPTKVVWVVIAAILIQALENYLLLPRIMKKSVGVSPILTLLALAAMTSLIGLPGALLAVPIAAIFQMVLNEFVLMPATTNSIAPPGRDQISLLRYEAKDLVQDVRKQLRQKENRSDNISDHIEDGIESIANDLDRILTRADQEKMVG